MRRSRLRRRAIRAAAAASLLAAATAAAEPIAVTATAVPMDAADAMAARAGELAYLGGLRLRSADPSFGGLSGLWVAPSGRSLVAVTDQGAWFTATLVFDEAGRLTGLDDADITPMRGIDDLPLLPPWSDAESIAVSGGRVYVSFERQNRLYRYGPPSAPWSATPAWLPLPDEIATGPRNGGLEAITELGDGRLLVFAEEIRRGDGLAAWILDDGVDAGLTLKSDGGYLPTGAATLADGDVLLLERRFSILGGFAARLRRIPRAAIAAGAVLDGAVVATLAPPLTTDNFEGIALVPLTDGGALVVLVSDDNFSALQRTLLLVFRISG